MTVDSRLNRLAERDVRSYLKNGNIADQLRAFIAFITIFTAADEIKWMFYDNVTRSECFSHLIFPNEFESKTRPTRLQPSV